jgi:hypothetical protein
MKYQLGDQIKEIEIDGAGGMHEEEEKCTRGFSEET